jgi:hypothetical protein
MNLQETESMLHLNSNSAVVDSIDLMRPNSPFEMLRQLSAVSEGFASGSTLMAQALKNRCRVIIAANMDHDEFSCSKLTCWICTHDEDGIDLVPLTESSAASSTLPAEPWADQLIGRSAKGEVLIVCDPWGDNELLCRALRVAANRGVATIAITTDQPNLLAVLAHHSIRVPVTAPFRREFVITALRHLVQTAGVSLIPAQRRATGPLREIAIA